jgi:hypothetical protein
MPLSSMRFTLREILVVVAAAALLAARMKGGYPYPETTLQRVVTVVIGLACGLGAMRHPLVLLAVVLVVWVFTPSANDPGFQIFHTLAAGGAVGWIIGAPLDSVARRVNPTNAASESSQTGL